MNTLKELTLAFVVVFVGSLAASLTSAAIYNTWFGGDEMQVTCAPKDQSTPPVKLNW
jgi:hypothetical protein